MYSSLYLGTIFLLWQLKLVDTFTMVQIFVNAGIQYGVVALGAASGNFSDIGPKTLFEPIRGFGVAARFIMAAETAAEKRARAATVAVAISSSITCLGMDPPVNMASGALTSAQISHWESLLPKLRGGSNQQIKNKLIKP